jgi:hypothetical protein
MSLIRPAIDEAQLARWAREQGSGSNALFHGTRHLTCILSDGYLKPTSDPAMVRFSRSADAAAYWAMMERDDDDGRGAILVFDRDPVEDEIQIGADRRELVYRRTRREHIRARRATCLRSDLHHE